MGRRINFCYNNRGWQRGFDYKNVLDLLIGPIREHLPDSTCSDLPVEGALNVQFLVETPNQQGVFISHGIADKAYRDAADVKGFEFIAVSGPAWVRKYLGQGMARERILEVGYTKLEPIFQGKIRRQPGEKPRVLWAPTSTAWGVTSSFREGQRLVRQLTPEYEGIWAPHPVQRAGHRATLQELADADVVIADAGSTLYEAWALGKPVIFPDWLVARGVLRQLPGTFEEQIYREGIGYHASSWQALLGMLPDVLCAGVDSAAKEFIERIFPVRLRGKSGLATAQALRRVA